MIGASTSPASCCQFELEIAIAASRQRVWNAIFEETNLWWLPDFHVIGEGSIVTFDHSPGGRGLVEATPDGGGLVWYTVQMYLPDQFTVYLIGHIAPEWGGPATSSLKLAVESTAAGSILKVTDARYGNVDEQQIQSSADGWKQLFTDGLKEHVETTGD